MNIGPYFNTYLYTKVPLHPTQMNNDAYRHIKDNLIKRLQGRCYMNYGMIVKIYAIAERSGGKIIAEDPTASSMFDIKFSCKLCRPLKNTVIVCEVVSITRDLIYLKNGPMGIMIPDTFINTDNFGYDEKRNVWIAYISKDGKGQPIVKGSWIKAIVIGANLEDKSDMIMVIGRMETVATLEESKKAIKFKEDDKAPIIEYDEYMAQEKDQVNEQDLIAEVSETEEDSETDDSDE